MPLHDMVTDNVRPESHIANSSMVVEFLDVSEFCCLFKNENKKKKEDGE